MKNQAAILLALLTMLLLGYWLGSQALSRTEFAFSAVQSQWQQTTEAYNQLREQHAQLHGRLLLQVAEIEQLKVQLNESVQEKLAQAQQLAFYRNVMAPESTQDGFIVDGLQLTSSLLPNTYRLRFVALQQRQQKGVVSGTFAITLSGSLHGEAHQLHSEQHDAFIEGSPEFRFKYFQVVELTLVLPQDFQPERIGVSTEVFQYGRKRGVYQSDFSWLDVIIPEADISGVAHTVVP